MLFSTPIFVAIFLPITLAGFWVILTYGSRRLALWWLFLASLFFYGWWNVRFVPLLLLSIGANFLLGAVIRRQPGRFWLILGLTFNLGLLVFFKYAGFIAGLAGVEGAFPGITLPLGISFFTFQQIMFLVDTYKGDRAAGSFLEYACFVAFFPHLISGPIVRPLHIIPQFLALRVPPNLRAMIADGLELFLLGLAKKLVLADSFARFADPGFAAAAHHDPLTLIEAWIALLSYTLQIYFDFSGYSDMAIGLARMFGIRFPINFNSPYQAANIGDFWRRWNMTLSGFLRDYLYIPMGGNRRGESRRMSNLMITMVLGGLWHGASLRFLLWGGLHGAFLITHGWCERIGIKLPALAGQLLTIGCVMLAWVPFRSPSFSAAVNFYAGLAGVNGVAVPAIFLSLFPGLSAFAHGVPVLPYLGDARTLSLPEGIALLVLGWVIVLGFRPVHQMSKRGRSLAIIASFAFSMQAMLFAPYIRPFLYFQF
jgi:D-alanyl-lipoteichoic acid acyltransferase DltB (MBOAT superfamily)